MTLFEQKCITYIPRLQKDLNITRIQACGIFGNLGTETGGFLHLQELNPTVKGSRGGYGWMQWTGPRRKKYEAWCKANNKVPSADESNYEYLVLETRTDELHSLIQLRKTTTTDAATETFMLKNLRPGTQHLDNRKRWAKIAEKATASTAPEAGAAATVAIGTGAAIAASPPEFLPLIIVGGILALIVGVGAIIWYKNKNTPETPEVVNTKKAKKNG